jgi:predicted alternative tryptophan synthase beta-subunit
MAVAAEVVAGMEAAVVGMEAADSTVPADAEASALEAAVAEAAEAAAAAAAVVGESVYGHGPLAGAGASLNLRLR